MKKQDRAARRAVGRGRWLGAAAVGILAGAGWTASPATASGQSGSNGTVLTQSTTEQLVFDAATAVIDQTSSFLTEIIGKLTGGSSLYDQTFDLPFSDPSVQAGVTQARLAITTAGGPAVVILGPVLTSQTVTTTSSSVTTYSLNRTTVADVVTTQIGTTGGLTYLSGGQQIGTDSQTPLGSTIYLNGQAIGTLTNLQGLGVGGQVNAGVEETVIGGVVQGPTPSFYYGPRSTCAAGVATLPSTIKPTCTPGGTPVLLGGGEVDINTDTLTTDYIDQPTVTTVNTLTSDVYTLTGTVKPFGTVHSAIAEAGFDQADRFIRRLLDAGGEPGAAASGGGSAPRDPAWAEAYGYSARTGAGGGFPGDTRNGEGINGGIDYDFTPALRLGVAFDYGASVIDESAAGEHGAVDLTQVGVYGAWRSGAAFADFAADYGWGQTSASVSPPQLGYISSSSYDLSDASASIEAGYRTSLGGVSLIPAVGAAWSHVRTGGFTETGSPLDLTGPADGYDREKAWLGVTASKAFEVGPGAAVTLQAYGRIDALAGNQRITLPVTFVGSSTPLAISGADNGPVGGDLGASATLRIKNVKAYVAYDAGLRERFSDQTASIGVVASF